MSQETTQRKRTIRSRRVEHRKRVGIHLQSLHRERFVSGTSAIKKENPLASFNEEGLVSLIALEF